MKISIINGSPRKSGATGKILRTIADRIKNNAHFEIRYYDLSDFEFKHCLGCEKCYQLGKCIINDGLEKMVEEIKKSDGMVIGSPTHGSNISAILKNFIDRGHFILEQSFYNKACFSLITYEIADGKSALKILNKFFIVSGGKLRNSILLKVHFNENPLEGTKCLSKIVKETNSFLSGIERGNSKPLRQHIFNNMIVVNLIWKKYFTKYPEQFKGIIQKYREKGIYSRIAGIKINNHVSH